MPTGKVKWYDAEKGFGFLSREDGDDVYVRSSSLPAGSHHAQGRHPGRVRDPLRDARATRPTRCEVLDAPPSVTQNRRAAQRKKPEDMVGIVEDLIRLLEGVELGYRAGRHPDAKTAKPTAKLLRGLADELDL